MFYFHEWLSRRCNGRFSIVWLAATHPKKLKPRDFLAVDVARCCNDVKNVILVREREDLPARQRPRFSLYLSSQLMYGIIVIYRKQMDIFFGELSSYFLIVDLPAKKIQKVPKGKKRKDEDESAPKKRLMLDGQQPGDQPRDPEVLPLAHVVQDISTITLREEVPRPPEPEEVFGEEIGPIPPAFFEGGNLMEMIIAMEAHEEQGGLAPPVAMETMLSSVQEPSTSDTTGVTLPAMAQDVSRPPEMQESAPLIELPELYPEADKASVGAPPKASVSLPSKVSVAVTPPPRAEVREEPLPVAERVEQPPAEPMEVTAPLEPPVGAMEGVVPPEQLPMEAPEVAVQPEQPPAEPMEVVQPPPPEAPLAPLADDHQPLQFLPDVAELQLPEAPVVHRPRRRRRGHLLVDQVRRIPMEDMQNNIRHYQDTMRVQFAREDVLEVSRWRTLEEMFQGMGTARVVGRVLTTMFQANLQSEMEPNYDLQTRLLHIIDEEERERKETSSVSSSTVTTPAERQRQRLSKAASSGGPETPDQPRTSFELEVLAEEIAVTPLRMQTVPEDQPVADDMAEQPLHAERLAEEQEPLPPDAEEQLAREQEHLQPGQLVMEEERLPQEVAEPTVGAAAEPAVDVGMARPQEPEGVQQEEAVAPQPSPPPTEQAEDMLARHARLSELTPESVLAALLPLWAAGNGTTTFRQLCPPPSTVRVRAAKIFLTLLNLSAKKKLRLYQGNERPYGEIFIYQTTATV